MDRRFTTETADELAVWAYEMSVSQEDLPYIVQSGTRPGSTKSIALYVDDLTINSDLVNPGRDIKIVARTVTLMGATTIDAAGPDPASTFAPGQLPVQADSNDGADGAAGASAGPAVGAGQITLVVGDIVDRTPTSAPEAGSVPTTPVRAAPVSTVTDWNTFAVSVLQDSARHSLFGAALATLTSQLPIPGPNGAITVAVTVSGGSSWTLVSAAFDEASDEVVAVIDLPGLSIVGTVDVFGMTMPVNSSTFDASVRVGLPVRWRNQGGSRVAPAGTIAGAVSISSKGSTLGRSTPTRPPNWPPGSQPPSPQPLRLCSPASWPPRSRRCPFASSSTGAPGGAGKTATAA